MAELAVLVIIVGTIIAVQMVKQEPDEFITREDARGTEIYDRHNGWFYQYGNRTEFVSFPRVRMELIKGLNDD